MNPSAATRRLFVRAALVLGSALLLAFSVPNLASAATYTITGGGWGHGIGLSQYGARGYALQGKAYSWILAHYYQGTRLVTKSSVTVKVHLDDEANARPSWWIQSGTTAPLTVIENADTTHRESLSATQTFWITTAAGNDRVHKDETYEVRNPDGSTSTRHRPGAIIRTFNGGCYATSGGSTRILTASGPFSWTGVRWRGTIHFLPYGATKSYAINHVGIEQYLYGVVPRECPSSWPAEALKAQAVAARSYAYEDARTGRTIYCTTRSQVYAGYSKPGTVLEAASTNSAVDATKGKVVWYGTESAPVKTFFSSSSGGHTASIQDVWIGSTPKAYYVGVTDADTASPDYRWDPISMSDSTMSSKVRTYDTNGGGGLDFSAPSPAVITAVTQERASSGYVHHVTLKWSNGQSFRINGTTLQYALGLKSSKYWISKSGISGTLTTYQQTDSRLAWVGPWYTARNSDASGGSYAYTAYYSSQCVVRFNGTGVQWIGNRGPAYGIAEVWLDGKKVATVNQYSARGARRITLFTKSGLASGEHQLMIKVINKKVAASAGYSSSVDRIDVINGSLLQADTPISRYEQTHSRIALLGDWEESTSTALSGGSHAWSLETGDIAVIDYFGKTFRWYGSSSPSYGAARVTIDGGTPKTVQLTTASPENQQLLFEAATSPSTAHHVVIEVLGPSSGGLGVVSVDRIDIVGGWILEPKLPVKRLEENSSLIAKAGQWTTSTVAAASGGRYAISGKDAGATMTLRFDGTKVSWIATKSKAYGKAAVIIDGTTVATVDLYSSTTKFKQNVFSRTLSRGDHTITIKTLGTKNASSSGTYVTVDALDVTGLALPPL